MRDKTLKNNKPQSDNEVLEVMQEYCQKKGYKFTDSKIRYLAEDCFLYWESRGWKGITYWPPLAMRWVLTNLDKQIKPSYKPKPQKGKSVRDTILEQENNDR